MRFVFSFLGLILITSIAYAENDNNRGYQAVGIGNMTCYEYLHPANGKDYVGRDIHIFSWAQGFMSGKNVYGGYNIDLLSIRREEQEVIMKVFCEEHKRERVSRSVEFLYDELYRITKGKGDK